MFPNFDLSKQKKIMWYGVEVNGWLGFSVTSVPFRK